MRMHALTAGCAVAAVTLTMWVSPAAQADDAVFVRDTQAIGFLHQPGNLISTGRSACYFLSRNRDPGQVTNRIKRYLAVDFDLAHRFLVMSVHEYCPQYRERIGA